MPNWSCVKCPKRIPFVTRKIIQLAFTKATLGTVTKIDRLFKRHILKISRRVGRQAGTQFPVLLSKACKRSQIPLALLPSLSPSWKSCPSFLKWISPRFPISFKLPQDSCSFHFTSSEFPFHWWLYCQHHHLEGFPSYHPWLYKLLLALPAFGIERGTHRLLSPANAPSLRSLKWFHVFSFFHLLSSSLYP